MRSYRNEDLQNNHCEERESKPAKETSKIPRASSAGRKLGEEIIDQRKEEKEGRSAPRGHVHQGLPTLALLALWAY